MTRLKIEGLFRDVRRNRDAQGYRLAQRVLAGDYNGLKDGIVRMEAGSQESAV